MNLINRSIPFTTALIAFVFAAFCAGKLNAEAYRQIIDLIEADKITDALQRLTRLGLV